MRKTSKLMTAMGTLGIALSISGTATAGGKLILLQSIDDYTDPVVLSAVPVESGPFHGGYMIETDLDEAYFEYDDRQIQAFYEGGGPGETAEFAVMEPARPTTPISWELLVAD